MVFFSGFLIRQNLYLYRKYLFMAYIENLTTQIHVYDDTVTPVQDRNYLKSNVSVQMSGLTLQVVNNSTGAILHSFRQKDLYETDNCTPITGSIKDYAQTVNGYIQDSPPVPGQVSGEGIKDYVARWSSDNRFVLTTGLFRDNGTTQSIRVAPDPNIQFYIYAPEVQTGQFVEVIGSGNGTNTGVLARSLNGTDKNIGVYGEGGGTIGSATASDTHYGVVGYALNNADDSIGVLGYGDGTTPGRVLGGFFYAENNGAGTQNAIRLVDGTEGAGKVLVSDVDGYASWQTIGAGSGDITDGDNLGAGAGVFAQKNGTLLEFKSLTEGTNIGFTVTGDEIEIAVTGLATVATSADYADLTNQPWEVIGGNIVTHNSLTDPKLLPQSDDTQDIGAVGSRWKDLYLGSKIDYSTVLTFEEAGVERLGIAVGGAITINQSYTLPTADGSAGQALITDGLGGITFSNVVTTYEGLSDTETLTGNGLKLLRVNAAGNAVENIATSSLALSGFNDDLVYIGAVVDDTTPQLGGNLDVNGNSIVSTSNGNISIIPNGTGDVFLGNFRFDADQSVGAGQDNYVLTYDDGTGKISLEAVSAGSSTFDALTDTPVNKTGAGLDLLRINAGATAVEYVDTSSINLSSFNDDLSYVTTNLGSADQTLAAARSIITAGFDLSITGTGNLGVGVSPGAARLRVLAGTGNVGAVIQGAAGQDIVDFRDSVGSSKVLLKSDGKLLTSRITAYESDAPATLTTTIFQNKSLNMVSSTNGTARVVGMSFLDSNGQWPSSITSNAGALEFRTQSGSVSESLRWTMDFVTASVGRLRTGSTTSSVPAAVDVGVNTSAYVSSYEANGDALGYFKRDSVHLSTGTLGMALERQFTSFNYAVPILSKRVIDVFGAVEEHRIIYGSTTSGIGYYTSALKRIPTLNMGTDGDLYVNSEDTSNGNFSNSKRLHIRAAYDSDAGAGFTESFQDAYLQHNISSLVSGVPTSSLDINVDTVTRWKFHDNGAIELTPITATAASAITPSEGMMVMVSNTNGTFTSIGFWAYENGAWNKL